MFVFVEQASQKADMITIFVDVADRRDRSRQADNKQKRPDR